jgi:hypothetical protein
MLSHNSRREKSIECSRPVDRLSVFVACPRCDLGQSAGSSSTGHFVRRGGLAMESPRETIRSYANLIAPVNMIFATDRSSVLGLPQRVRKCKRPR